MFFEFFVAFRYLKAKRKQIFISLISFLSILGISLGVMALIVVLAVMTGFERDLKEKILGTNAHAVVFSFSSDMRDYMDISKEIEKLRGVVGVTPFIYRQVLISSSIGTQGIVLRGIDPLSSSRVIKLENYIKEGSIDELPSNREGKGLPGIILGKELARNLGVFYGDTVNLITTTGRITPGGMLPRTKTFRVAGIFDSGMYVFDSSFAYILLRDAQVLFGMGDSVTGLEISVSDIYSVKEITGAIKNMLGPAYIVKDWMEMNRNFFTALKLEKIIMFIILTLIVLVAAFGIVSTLIMLVMEKTKDIAILKSLGVSSRRIMMIFVIKGLMLGGGGTLIGYIAGIGVAKNLDGIASIVERLTGIEVFPRDIYYIERIPSQINPYDIALILFSALIISFLATLYPAWQASKLDPAEALRYE